MLPLLFLRTRADLDFGSVSRSTRYRHFLQQVVHQFKHARLTFAGLSGKSRALQHMCSARSSLKRGGPVHLVRLGSL